MESTIITKKSESQGLHKKRHLLFRSLKVLLLLATLLPKILFAIAPIDTIEHQQLSTNTQKTINISSHSSTRLNNTQEIEQEEIPPPPLSAQIENNIPRQSFNFAENQLSENHKKAAAANTNLWFLIAGLVAATLLSVAPTTTQIRKKYSTLLTLILPMCMGILIMHPTMYIFFEQLTLTSYLKQDAFLKILNCIFYAWAINWSIAAHYQTREYSLSLLIKLLIACLLIALIIPSSILTTLGNILAVSITTSYFLYTASLYIKRNGTLLILAMSTLQVALVFFLTCLILFQKKGIINFNEYSLIQSSIIWTDLVLLIFFIRHTAHSIKSDTLTLALDVAKQEQKIASLSPFIQASRHDLRAPLSDIIGLSELIADHPLDQSQRREILELQHVARTALDKINVLFSYTPKGPTASFGKTSSTEELFNVSALIEECTQFFSFHCAEKNKELVVDTQLDNCEFFIGDHERIRQLVIHAIEYFLIVRDTKDLYIEISIENSRRLNVIFSCSTTEAGTSELDSVPTLKLAHSIIEDLHGSFQINPAGNKIHLQLPLKTTSAQEQKDSRDKLLKGKRVLVVDDNLISCKVICSYLSRWEIEAKHSTNTIDALAIIHHQQAVDEPFDLIIADYLMPKQNGIELIIEIANDITLKNPLAAIIMSNASQTIGHKEARNYGVHHVLEKPVLASTLKITLQEAFSLAHSVEDGFAPINSSSREEHKDMRALLVEDNPVSARITGAHLHELCIMYDWATSGAIALDYLDEKSYDIILMDCELPDYSGIEITIKLRNIEKERGLKNALVVALTAEDSDDNKKLCLDSGMDEFLSKPINKIQISKLILGS